MKLSLSMICKDELKNLKRLKPLVKKYVDEWVVVFPPGDPAIEWAKNNGIKTIVKDFTQTIEKDVLEKFLDYRLEVAEDYRLFNFAAARNESLANATGDYVLWLDADDTPKGLDALLEVLEGKDYDYYDVVYDYARDEQGNSIADQIRERVVKNGKFEWKGGALGLIHETLIPKDGVFPSSIRLDKETFYIEHNSDHQDQSSDRNFIALLYEYIKTNGKDPRTVYYLGVEFFNHRMYDQSIKIMQEYVEVGGWDEERFRAYIRMAEAYHQLGDKESSRNAYLKAQKELPGYPESYLGLGESYFSDEMWDKAIEYTLTGMQKPVPQTKSGVDMIRYTFRPLNFLALANMKLGKNRDAYYWFDKARVSNPNHPWVLQYTDLFEEMKDLDDYVRSFAKIGQLNKKYYPASLPKLAEAIPDEIMDQEVLLDYRRRFSAPKVWPKKSVVYFCSQAFEEWGPDSLKTGTGGSEEAVIHLTKRWAKMGYDVTVFNNCPVEKTVDGVRWTRYERFNPKDVFDVLIGWRNNPYLEQKAASTKLLDLHDVPALKFFPKESVKDAKLMVKSQYHRSLFPHLPDENFIIINNGIDTDQFNRAEKVQNNLVWTSSYDRGLEYLLEMWPQIKQEVPDATLDVAYGFNLFDMSARGRTEEGKRWKKKMLDLLQQEGVTEHGRLPSDEVAQLYNKADVWAYPTDFPEIDCITATKAMAAGCVPVTTDFAVMKERNKEGVIIEGSAADESVREEFRLKLIALLQDDERKRDIRSRIDVSEFDWDNVAQRWAENF